MKFDVQFFADCILLLDSHKWYIDIRYLAHVLMMTIHGPNVLCTVLAILRTFKEDDEDGEPLFDINDFSTEEDGRFEANAEMMEKIDGLSWATHNYDTH